MWRCTVKLYTTGEVWTEVQLTCAACALPDKYVPLCQVCAFCALSPDAHPCATCLLLKAVLCDTGQKCEWRDTRVIRQLLHGRQTLPCRRKCEPTVNRLELDQSMIPATIYNLKLLLIKQIKSWICAFGYIVIERWSQPNSLRFTPTRCQFAPPMTWEGIRPKN